MSEIETLGFGPKVFLLFFQHEWARSGVTTEVLVGGIDMTKDKRKSKKEIILHSFGNWLISQKKSDSTTNTYVGVLSQFLQWLNVDVTEIDSSHVQAYMDYLDSSNKSAGTIEKHYVAITMFSRFLGNRDIVLNIDRKLKEKKDEIPESLGKLEQEALLKEVEDEGNLRNIAIVYTLLHTGIRVSELCDLNIADIQEENGRQFVIVRNSKGEMDRVIPLSKAASKNIRIYRESLKKDPEALFVSSVNQRLTPRSVQYMLNKYNVHPHKLRHTFCQNLIDNRIDIQTVSKLAGHKDLNVTKRYVKESRQRTDWAIENTFDNIKYGT
jgi:integrase/recombinase XerD